eukprot:1133518-Pleurochrysis_carterae.AAC.2
MSRPKRWLPRLLPLSAEFVRAWDHVEEHVIVDVAGALGRGRLRAAPHGCPGAHLLLLAQRLVGAERAEEVGHR